MYLLAVACGWPRGRIKLLNKYDARGEDIEYIHREAIGGHCNFAQNLWKCKDCILLNTHYWRENEQGQERKKRVLSQLRLSSLCL